MLRNLFLTLFLFVLALPALAVPVTPAVASEDMETDCHGMPKETQDSDSQKHDKSVRLHGCIGCVAPVSPVFGISETTTLPFITQTLPHRELSGTIANDSGASSAPTGRHKRWPNSHSGWKRPVFWPFRGGRKVSLFYEVSLKVINRFSAPIYYLQPPA